MPHEASLQTIYSYYLSTVNVNPEGDVNVSNELNLQGLGSIQFSLIAHIKPLGRVSALVHPEATDVFLSLFNRPFFTWILSVTGI